MRIRVDVDKAGVELALETLEARLRDWRPVWGEIRKDFQIMEERRFGLAPWQGWGRGYIFWDDPATGRHFDSTRVLHKSGGLERSLTHTTGFTVNEQLPLSAKFGTNYEAESNAGVMEPVAKLLDEGFTARGRMWTNVDGKPRPIKVTGVHVPARPLIDDSRNTRRRWGRQVGRWVGAEIDKVGLG